MTVAIPRGCHTRCPVGIAKDVAPAVEEESALPSAIAEEAVGERRTCHFDYLDGAAALEDDAVVGGPFQEDGVEC